MLNETKLSTQKITFNLLMDLKLLQRSPKHKLRRIKLIKYKRILHVDKVFRDQLLKS